MATRAERFRYTVERSGPKRRPKPRRRRRDVPVDTAKKGVSATDRKAGLQSTAERNRYSDERDAPRVLEGSATGRPSRKSSRKGPIRSGSQLTRRQQLRIATPEARTRQGK